MTVGPLKLRRAERLTFEAGDTPWRRGEAAALGILEWGDSVHARPLLRHPDLREPLLLRPADDLEARRFQRMREGADHALAEPRPLRRGRIELNCWAFRRRAWEFPVELVVDDRVADSVRRIDPDVNTVDAAIAWLTQECIIEIAGASFVVVSGIALDAPIGASFMLHGATRTVKIDGTQNDLLLVESVTPPQRSDTRQSSTLALAQGDLRFVDRGAAKLLEEDYRRHVKSAQDPAYLRAWDRYFAIEIARALQDVRDLGAIPYTEAHAESDRGWRVTLANPADAARLDRSEAYHAVSEIPRTLLATGQAADTLKRLREEVYRFGTSALELAGRPAPVLELRTRREDGERLPADGFLILSRSADWDQLERRSFARLQLARHHGLSLALAGRRPPDPPRATRTLPDPLPADVEAVFKHGSTRGQREALKAVFENSGLSVIQGPPGTGKSTVIAALHKLLTHLDGQDARRSIVVCAPQHEAVDNVAAKIEVFGLPPYRFHTGRDPRAHLDSWALEHADRIEQQIGERRHGDVKQPQRVEDLRRMAARYRVTPETVERTARLLAELAERGALPADDAVGDNEPLLSADLRQRLRARASELESRRRGDRESWADRRRRTRRCAALLRTTTSSFADDGSQAAARARAGMHALGLLDDASAAVLDRAISAPVADDELCQELAALRGALLDRIASSSQLDRSSIRDAPATALAGEVVDELSRWLDAHVDPVERVLRRMLDRIAYEPSALTDAVQTYAVALAATTQGVGAKGFRELLAGSDSIRTAIVDEAGRGKPIDVLIPLVAARDRQILVGDHRQLPQLLEPEIESAVSEQIGPEFAEALKESLFERLFTTLQGTSRCVTLREQFRMHSELARFVSDTFYPEGERFGSVRDDDEFRHDLGGAYRDRIALWLDVPGERESGRTSKSRRAEAARIAAEVERLMADSPHLTFGVVAMYSAQVLEIKRQLGRIGVLQQSGDEWLMPDEAGFLLDEHGLPVVSGGKRVQRLAVGTVDSFQGREFDVVFVSLVRCNDHPTSRRRFGFVAMPNRLNVAMSRQRRLLVVCGDRRTFLHGDAESWPDAEPLRRFDELCSRDAARTAMVGAAR